MNTDDLSFAFVLISITTIEASTTNSGGNEIIIDYYQFYATKLVHFCIKP